MQEFFDAHTHVQFAAYDADREAVISRAEAAGVRFVNVGTQKDTSRRAVELAEQHEGVFAAIGFIRYIRHGRFMMRMNSAEVRRRKVLPRAARFSTRHITGNWHCIRRPSRSGSAGWIIFILMTTKAGRRRCKNKKTLSSRRSSFRRRLKNH